MLFQWLVASPVVILDKVKQWENKLRRNGYRIFPCPETPFSVEWDAFRDWKDFTMNWTNPGWQSELSQKTVLVDVSASLLYDLGYFADSFWLSSQYKSTESNQNTFQFIHKTGYYMVQLKYQNEIPVLIRWTRYNSYRTNQSSIEIKYKYTPTPFNLSYPFFQN